MVEISDAGPAVAVKKRGRPALLACEAQLFVAEITAACRFYVDRLGFSIAFTYGEPAHYAQVRRNTVRLNLRAVDAPPIDPARREREQLLSASIVVDDTETLFREFEATGVEFHERLVARPWGARTFVVRDPDGNLILFSAAMEAY